MSMLQTAEQAPGSTDGLATFRAALEPQQTCQAGVAAESFRLPAWLIDAVAALAANTATRPDSVLLAAFKTLLHRYTAQNEIAVGGVTEMGGCAQAGPADRWVGRGVVVRTQPSAALSFGTYLVRVHAALLLALDAGDRPATEVLDALEPVHGTDHPLLSRARCSILLGHASPPGSCDAPPADGAAWANRHGLHLRLGTGPDGGSEGCLVFDNTLLDPAMVRHLAGHFGTLLAAAVADPDSSLDTLPLLTAEESLRIGQQWNSTEQPAPDILLHRWFEAQASRTPDAAALEFEGRQWSYRDLNRRADQLARRLSGATAGTLVAVCLERSPDLVAGLLAVLKRGAAFLPLDPAFPMARLELIADDARPALLLTQRSLEAKLPQSGARIVFCDDDAPEAEPSPGASVAEPAQALAYVLYTSGSTGRPKGVEVSHRSVVNLLASMQREPGFTPDDALLAVTTIAFDIAILELFLPLVSGGRIILASREVGADPRQLSELLCQSGCTVMQATPATWRGLIASGWQGNDGLRILCGGENMSRDLACALLARCGGLWNMYGPTETTIWSTVHRVRPGGHGPVPIGRPIGNTTCFILDPHGRLVPPDLPGELHIGGRGVAAGYRGNPVLTAERFTADPLAPEQRLYRTGDIARYRADGVIEWLARADNQIKIRGFRIEAQEVEAALERHPDVSAAAVRTWPDVAGQPALVAYVVAPGEGADAAGLRQFLRRTLPDYMVPARYSFLPALPLTPNGKIDRKALPEPAPLLSRGEAAAPASAVERKLALLWEQLLGVASPGPDDDFFELGGDSVLAVSLLLSIEAEFNRRLTMAALFQAPTVGRMAALLDTSEAETRLPLAAEIQPEGSRPRLFWIDGGPMFLPLSNALGLDQPFLGVTLNPAELREVGFEPSLETIAQHLVRTITTIQPAGPYVIGGYCAGGVLAFEVASQLMAAGRAVGLLCLIDAQNPTHFKRVGNLAVEFAKLRHHLAGVWQAGGTGRRAYMARHLKSACRRLLFRSTWRPVMKSEPFTLGEIMQPAVLGYRPGRYPGRVALFQARRPKALDLRPGWAATITGELLAYEFAGTHGTMLQQPQVQRLARLMNGCLDAVGNPSGSTRPQSSRCNNQASKRRRISRVLTGISRELLDLAEAK